MVPQLLLLFCCVFLFPSSSFSPYPYCLKLHFVNLHICIFFEVISLVLEANSTDFSGSTKAAFIPKANFIFASLYSHEFDRWTF